MNITSARRTFEKLKAVILADGKVDFAETEVLIDFIEPYVKGGNRTFVEFNRLLYKFREDGKIDEQESKALVACIDSMSKFLKNEQIVEWVLAGLLGLFAAGIAVSQLIAYLAGK